MGGDSSSLFFFAPDIPEEKKKNCLQFRLGEIIIQREREREREEDTVVNWTAAAAVAAVHHDSNID